ncbi:hypothetical protein [Aquamicrobium sp.]|uniref:hypothetical protein n=1 Tax=Aquamicrobium sp. TaxID=1872579 RepID=UPI00258C1446|nr:hypothetical protein [Aquamicrobium sp.]MCK9549239.1 hypothetical protein [Aquamicrobium sp.]
MKTRRIFLTALTVWALLGTADPIRADDGIPVLIAPVQESYHLTGLMLSGTAGGGVAPWRLPYRDKLFSKALAALFQRDETYQEESGTMGHLDVNPFVSGQAGEVKDLHIAVAGNSSDRQADVIATFQSLGRPQTVRFQMILENGVWRIDDIIDRVEDRDYSLAEQFDQPYPCGSFMHKPCR